MTKQIKPAQNINHVAIIMDGNGRWANSRSHTRIWGHVRGSSVVSNIVEEADALGVKALTLYAFSSENWSRPLTEVKSLFLLLNKFLKKERLRILENKIRFRVIGDTSYLPEPTQILIHKLELETKDNGGLKLFFAFNYGSRAEIIDAINSLRLNKPSGMITEEDLEQHLYLPEAGDVDLLIRTGGEQRISNFLLWQLAYAELYFTATKWPDFTTEEFRSIILSVTQRERRYGNVQGNTNYAETLKTVKRHKDAIKSQKHE